MLHACAVVLMFALLLANGGTVAAELPEGHIQIANDRKSAGRRPAYAPLERVHCTGVAPDSSLLTVRDGRARIYARTEVTGQFAFSFQARGALGPHRCVLDTANGRRLAVATFMVDARSEIRCPSLGYGWMWRELEESIGAQRQMRTVGETAIVHYSPRLREETQQMKAYRYWEPQPGGLHEHLLSVQCPDGMLYSELTPRAVAEEREEAFGARYCRTKATGDVGYSRLPTQADTEYLAVEGVYTAWQARADDDWMARLLPALERALAYSTSDPLRWSSEYQLVKRPYTIDTWDIKFLGFDRADLADARDAHEQMFNIRPETPLCIMHGDNSGMFQAYHQMAVMLRALGREHDAARYIERAEHFRQRTNELCWNGKYYDHWVPLTPLELDQGGIDGRKVLSASNVLAITRGITTPEQTRAILSAYGRMLGRAGGVAEWVSAKPHWPKGFSGIEPGESINGGILALVAGELARAALQNGRETYAISALWRIQIQMGGRRAVPPGAWSVSGEPSYGVSDAVAHAALAAALMEGLAGLRDGSRGFEVAHVEPRWLASDVREAYACARYGASDSYVCYDYFNDFAQRYLKVDASGSGSTFVFHLLLPSGMQAEKVTLAARPIRYTQQPVGRRMYVDFVVEGPLTGPVIVSYRRTTGG